MSCNYSYSFDMERRLIKNCTKITENNSEIIEELNCLLQSIVNILSSSQQLSINIVALFERYTFSRRKCFNMRINLIWKDVQRGTENTDLCCLLNDLANVSEHYSNFLTKVIAQESIQINKKITWLIV